MFPIGKDGTEVESLVPQSSSLGSLTQSQREKKIRQARNLLWFIGGLTIVVNLIQMAYAESLVAGAEKQLLKEGKVLLDKAKVIEMTRLLTGAFAFVGVLFVIFGLLVRKYPLPMTITSLVVYLGSQAIVGVMDLQNLFAGIAVKVFIIIGLIQAIKAAAAYQKEAAQSMAEPRA